MLKRVIVILILGLAFASQLPRLGALNSTPSLMAAPRKTPKPTRAPRPSPTPTSTPAPTPTATPIPTPLPTSTPTPTPSPSPSPTIYPTITSVTLLGCSIGSSCSNYISTVDVRGTGFAFNSYVTLKPSYLIQPAIYGTKVYSNGSTRIMTDFYGLPRCTVYDVTVSGSTGITTAYARISTVCP